MSRPLIVRLVSLVALLTLLAACGGGSGEQDSRVKITLLVSNLVQPGIEAEIANFERANPGIDIEPTFVPAEQARQLVLTRLASGQAPDIFVTTPGSVGPISVAAIGDKLLDLTGSSWIDAIPDQERAPVAYRGKVVGYPAFLTAGVLIYNKDLFAEKGWPIPTTTQELLTLCRQVDEAGIAPVIVPGADALAATPLLAANHSYVFAKTPDWLTQRRAGAVRFASSPEWRASLDSLIAMKSGGCFRPDAAGVTLKGGFQQMASGSAAMFATTAAQLGSIKAINPSVDFALLPFPGPTADDRQIATASGLTLGVNATTAHPNEAKAFLEFLGQPVEAARFAEQTGGLSYAAASSGRLPERWSQLAPVIHAGRLGPFWTVDTPNPNFFPYSSAAMQGLLSGQLTPDAVLAKFDALWDDPRATP